MRLIDGDALIAELEEEAKDICNFDHKMMVYGAINNVKKQPTIDIPIGVAIVVSEDGTVNKLVGVKL